MPLISHVLALPRMQRRRFLTPSLSSLQRAARDILGGGDGDDDEDDDGEDDWSDEEEACRCAGGREGPKVPCASRAFPPGLADRCVQPDSSTSTKLTSARTLNHSTPLEEIDPYAHLMDALARMQAHMPTRYAAVVGGADASLQEGLHSLHAHVEAERQNKQAQQQAQQQQ